MRLITVGTGTVVPDPDRASACHWVEEEGTRVIIDCGAGALQGLARAGLPWGTVDHLVISHFHADHIVEIPALIFALKHAQQELRTDRLDVWGPVGSSRLFAAWADAYGGWISEPGFKLAIHDVQPGRSSSLGSLRFRFTHTPHTEESLALRIEGSGSALGYTGDSGPDDALAEFFRGVDLLLAECSLPDELALDIHLTPSGLARLATGSGAGRLAVTHVYPQLRRLDVPELIRQAGYSGEIIMARDGMELDI